MANFQIKGLNAQGQVVECVLSTTNPDEARALAQQMGIQLLEIRGQIGVRSLLPHRIRFDLALFCQELLALLRAGLSLIEALETLDERQQSTEQPSVLMQTLVLRMKEGKSFSQGLQEFPAEFPDIFVASIAASEQTGEMVEAIERYLRYHEQVSFIRQKLVSASLYPAMLLVVGLGVAIFLLCFLVPRFSHIYEGMDAEIPLASRLLMQWGGYASEHVIFVSLIAVALTLGVFGLFRHGVLQAKVFSLLQKNYWLGQKLRLMQLSRFYRSLSLLLRGGIPVIKALRMTHNLLPLILQPALSAAIKNVDEGQTLSASLHQNQLTTAVALRLLRAGERNGQVADMLENISAFHDKEIATWIDRFARLVEPILMLVIGGIIGGIVILLYLPIFELAGNLQ